MDKAYVITEIRRTANENNGIPLGTQAFTRETGIKRTDWYGKYWARWSDALLEAGFEANKFQEAYDLDFLCEKYAQLTQELGRIPVTGEVRLKAQSDKSFPSHNTFRRLGKKPERLSLMLEFCESNEGYSDLTDLFRIELQNTPQKSETQESPKVTQDGYVYLIKSGRHYKIGYTNDFHRRSKEIAIELPERATTIHVITTDDPSGIEAYWHNRFKDKRGNGEWFELTSSDVKAFRRRKFM